MDQPTPPPFQSATLTSEPTTTPSGQPLPPSATDSEYINNPFSVAITGIQRFFKYAKPIAILFVVLSLLSALTNVATSIADIVNESSSGGYSESAYDGQALPTFEGVSSEQLTVILSVMGGIFLMFFVVFVMASIIMYGLRDVAAAAAVNRQQIGFGETFSRLFKRLPGYIGLSLLVGVKVFLWSLLFIVPGIIMAVRYSLAGTAYFARNMKASEAIDYSKKITKDGWMTTFASYGWLNLVTLGFIQLLVQPGAQVQIFSQYDRLEQTGGRKPGAHALSIAFTILYFLMIALVLTGLALFAVFSVANYS